MYLNERLDQRILILNQCLHPFSLLTPKLWPMIGCHFTDDLKRVSQIQEAVSVIYILFYYLSSASKRQKA